MSRPRIRTIKPEFWTDGFIAGLSHSAALFYIALWNFADDEGKFLADPDQLALKIPIFRKENIKPWLSRLQKSGRLSVGSLSAQHPLSNGSASAWYRLTNWSHQRINRPIRPKVKTEDIQWDGKNTSVTTHEYSVRTHGVDRIGSDRIGSDISRKRVRTESVDNKKVWESYSSAYFQLYKTEPVRNARVNSLIKQFATRLGAEAPSVAEFYLTHRDSFYLRSLHSLSLMVRDAEKLHTEWRTGRQMLGQQARQVEMTQANAQALMDSLGAKDLENDQF